MLKFIFTKIKYKQKKILNVNFPPKFNAFK